MIDQIFPNNDHEPEYDLRNIRKMMGGSRNKLNTNVIYIIHIITFEASLLGCFEKIYIYILPIKVHAMVISSYLMVSSKVFLEVIKG
jgi:hypothetical protein